MDRCFGCSSLDCWLKLDCLIWVRFMWIWLFCVMFKSLRDMFLPRADSISFREFCCCWKLLIVSVLSFLWWAWFKVARFISFSWFLASDRLLRVFGLLKEFREFWELFLWPTKPPWWLICVILTLLMSLDYWDRRSSNLCYLTVCNDKSYGKRSLLYDVCVRSDFLC